MQPHPAGLVANAPGTALSALKFNGSTLTPEQQQFNALLARTEALALRIEDTQKMANDHRPLHSKTLRPLLDQREALMRNMALWLHERLGQSGLSRAQRQAASAVICSLCAVFVQRGDDGMRLLHAAHSPDAPADQPSAGTDDAKALPDDGVAAESAPDAQDADEQQLRQRAQAHQAARAAHKARRTKSAKQRQAEQQVADADGALRKVFRQLASALHPDRENDPGERARKNAWMSEANTAYARRDLPALLDLQLRTTLADGPSMAVMAREKLAVLTALLEERVGVLADALRSLEARVQAEFDLPGHLPLNPVGLKRHLQAQKQGLLADIGALTHEMRLLHDDTELKRWLREQRKLAP